MVILFISFYFIVGHRYQFT